MDRVSSFGKILAEVVYQTITYLLPITAVILILRYWTDLTTCFQREGVCICCFLAYWRFAKPRFPGFIWEILQFALIFWIAYEFNEHELEKDPTCLEHNEIYPLFLLKASFNILLVMYTLACIFFILFFVGAIIYVIVDHFFLEPRRRRLAGFSDSEFEHLGEI